MTKQLPLKWNGTNAQFSAPDNPAIQKDQLDLTLTSYQNSMNTRDDFAANPASQWVAKLFKKGCITACSVQNGSDVILTPAFSAGDDADKKNRVFKNLMRVLSGASKLEVVFHDETIREAKNRVKRSRPLSDQKDETWWDILIGSAIVETILDIFS